MHAHTNIQNQVFPDGCLGLRVKIYLCEILHGRVNEHPTSQTALRCGWKSCLAMLILITHVKIYIERESATLFAFYGRRRLWMELFNTKFHNVGKDVINF
jgi:hypothetical protein